MVLQEETEKAQNRAARFVTRQSAQWGTYTPDQRYRQFLKSTKYVALTLEMAALDLKDQAQVQGLSLIKL